ncbi:MAG TPA: branched-chain amino acid ABC transporter substrate-binding protein [Gaiellaceae bacterium]|jgi:branched-chain amino acid transport system substrate-binding protein|nr:branched-chain amino acid ABC transporter substrate-binding protein [Gaiellaceae bacterium]
MRKYVVAALAAAGVAALATAAFGSTSSQSRTSAAASPATASVTCGKTRTIGLAAPITGPAAAIGNQQVRWAKYYVKRWNAQKANKNKQIKVVPGDTQLGVDTAFAVKVAKSFASNSKLLGVVGPAGSQEVVASTSSYKGGGLGFVSGSATRTTLTDGHTDGNRRGFFFRTVPNDGAQAPVVANWMTQKLKWKRVYIIDDQETYSQGLADGVQKILAARGVKVTRDSISQTDSDFSSKIAKIPSNTQGIYIPWQLAPQAQGFGQQLQGAGKGHIKLFGSDGLFAPGVWKIAGSYDSAFPYNPKDPIVTSYIKAHKGNGEFFGLPSYVAAQVVVGAVTKACADGKATRAEVRKDIAKTKLKTTILGFPLSFAASGEMRAPATFGVFQIQKNGSFSRIG